MVNFFAVFVGGGLGSLCRYMLSMLIPTTNFPWATLFANIIACFLLGAITSYLLKNQLNDSLKLLVGTGFCGGFSTFSTFTKEVLDLGTVTWQGLGYLLLSLLLGIIAVYLGMLIK